MNPLFILIVSLIAGFGSGYVVRHYMALFRRNRVEEEIEEKILEAKKKARELVDESEEKAKSLRDDLQKSEERILKQEERLDKRDEDLVKREQQVSEEIISVRNKEKDVQKIKENLEEKQKMAGKEIERIAQLTRDEARAILFHKTAIESEEDIKSRLFKLSRDGEARLEEKARDILTNCIHRLANNDITSFVTTTVAIESDEIKRKIMGKEGRNIKTFEKMSGVELLVDEAPNEIVVSCFDPVRRAIAVNALEMLIKDGRIQPAKIEELIEKARKDMGGFIKKKGEEAILVSGVLSVPETIIPLLGRLYFRTSYGQNVLDHSVEMVHLAGMLASELGADVQTAKMGALLHDIGKAVDHEIQGTHVEIGRRILMKYGVSEKVILAMQAHHEEYPYETIESVIVQVADSISGGRPGARRDTVERYIKRLEDLEAVALAFSGIEKVYALQAGREIRVFVTPSLVSDLQAMDLARNIATRIEQELNYPGEIKISVIRESRVIEFAR